MSMTRAEAIDHLRGLSDQVAGEFCINADERDRLERETADALVALGVDPTELDK